MYDHGGVEEATSIQDGGVPAAVNELTHRCCLSCRLATLVASDDYEGPFPPVDGLCGVNQLSIAGSSLLTTKLANR